MLAHDRCGRALEVLRRIHRDPHMKALVGDAGILIPLRLLRGVREVQIRKDGHNILVEPVVLEGDPIFGLGRSPVRVEADDAAEQHDKYLYAAS